MATQEEKQAYIDEMAEKRGYVLDYHKVMAEQDFEVLQAANGLIEAAYLKERGLDRKTKELLFIVSLTVMRASKGHIQSHIRVALDLGLSITARANDRRAHAFESLGDAEAQTATRAGNEGDLVVEPKHRIHVSRRSSDAYLDPEPPSWASTVGSIPSAPVTSRQASKPS